jgi:hypothetical protein
VDRTDWIACSRENGTTSLTFGYFQYSAHQAIDKVLFFTFGEDKVRFSYGTHCAVVLHSSWTDAPTGNQKLVLNEDLYGKVRKNVEDKLGDNAKKYINDIALN